MSEVTQLSPAPEFNQQLVKKFDKDIRFLIQTGVYNYGTSDMCYDYDDVYQECLIHLNTAVEKYDSTRGMKFRTFAIMHLKSRLSNLRAKILRRNAAQTYSMTELDAGWGITGTEPPTDYNPAIKSLVSSQYDSSMNSLMKTEDSMNELIDAKTVLHRLGGQRQIIYAEYYLKGKRIKEICEDYPHLKYNQIRRHMRYIDQIYKTLVKGETSNFIN